MDNWAFERQARLSLKSRINDFGGLLSAGTMNEPGGLFIAIIATLAPYYREGNEEVRIKIDNIIDEEEFFRDKRSDEDPEFANFIHTQIREIRANHFMDDYRLDS